MSLKVNFQILIGMRSKAHKRCKSETDRIRSKKDTAE